MKEVFKDIAGYEGLYQVSNLGRVKSLGNDKSRKEKILRPGIRGNGYLLVILWKNGKRKNYLVHRLVSETFLDNPDNLPCVNHRDENKQNNCVSNLEFCTYQYNNTFNDKHRKKAKKVGCYKDGKLIKVYDAIIDVEKDGFYQGTVVKCCKGRYKSTGGFQWKYID